MRSRRVIQLLSPGYGVLKSDVSVRSCVLQSLHKRGVEVESGLGASGEESVCRDQLEAKHLGGRSIVLHYVQREWKQPVYR